MLIDTGSTKTLLAKEVFDSLGMTDIKCEPSDTTLVAANSEKLNVYGKVTLPMSVGKKQVIQNFVVADIVTCQGILGMDFLTQNRGKVDIEKKTLKLGKVKIWLKSNLDNGISRVQLLESINISPYTEAFVQCYLDRPCFLERGIVEPAKFLKGRKLLLAKTLVDPQNQVILSLVNLGEKPVKLDSETVIGMMYPVDSVCTLVPDCEHEKDTIEIPEHLKPLLENVSENLNVHQRSELKTLVGNYRDIFKDPEGSLGQTDFVLHEIDTGNARPIKLPLRRVPLKQREVIEDELNKMLQENIIEPSDSPLFSYQERWVITLLCRFSEIKSGHS